MTFAQAVENHGKRYGGYASAPTLGYLALEIGIKGVLVIDTSGPSSCGAVNFATGIFNPSSSEEVARSRKRPKRRAHLSDNMPFVVEGYATREDVLTHTSNALPHVHFTFQ